jgi:phosphatidylglycerol:prolipoprotein diacylglycerol transferase
MTVYPFLIHFGRFTITGYGIMMMFAFLVAGWVYAQEVARAGLDTAIAWDSVVWAVIGGLLGGKVYYAILVGDPGALLSRGGLVWYGGFTGGLLAVFGYMGWRRLPIRRLLDLIAPAMVVGYLLGRVGCFLVNDDYGVPTSLPWGMAFPRGAPPSTAAVLERVFHLTLPPGTSPEQVMAVHPTQLYEIALMFAIFVFLWRIREHKHGATWLFGLYLVLSAAERFLVEFLRAKDDRFFTPFTLAQLLSVGVVVIGVWLMRRYARPDATASEPVAA